MAFNNPYKSSLSSLLGSSASGATDMRSQSNIARQEYADGKVKVFLDPTGKGETIEIWPTDTKKISIYKEESQAKHIMRYKEIQASTVDNEPLGTVNITADYGMSLHQSYRFFDGNNYIGSGSGDFAYVLANKLLKTELEPTLTAGADIDDDVVKFFQGLLNKPIPMR